LRFAGRFVSLRWRCVRWQWSRWRPRLQQGLIITAQGGTPARITPITHIITALVITAIVIMAATSRGRGRMPADNPARR
jgi:hypothetical protein